MAQVFLGHCCPFPFVLVVSEHLNVRLQIGLRLSHIDGCLLIGINLVLRIARFTVLVHGHVITTNPQTTLLHHLHPVRVESTHRHEHHGVDGTIGHTVSFHVDKGFELGTICLVHGLIANIVHQGMHSHFRHWATKCFTQIGDRVFGDIAVFLPRTHTIQGTNHFRLAKDLHQLGFTVGQRLGVYLDTHGLSQAQNPHLVAITGLVVKIQCRFSRQQSLTYQLAGLRAERTQLLHPTNSAHVVVETNVNLFRGQTEKFSTSRQLGMQFIEPFESIQTRLNLSTLGFQIIDVGVVLIDFTRTIQSRDALFAQRGIKVEHDGVETERRSSLVLQSLHLLGRIANVRVTHLGLRHMRTFPIQEEGFLRFAQDDLIQSIRVLEVRFGVIQFGCSVGNHRNNLLLISQFETCVVIVNGVKITSGVELQSLASEHAIFDHGTDQLQGSIHCNAIRVSKQLIILALYTPVGFDACSQIVDQLKVGQTARQHFEDMGRDLVLINAQNLRSFAFIKGLGRPFLTLQQPLQTSHGHSIHKVLVVLQSANAIDHDFFRQRQSTQVVKAQDVIDLALIVSHPIQQLANTILVLLLLLTCHEVLKVLVHVLLPACSKTQQVVIALTNLFI